MAVRTIKANIKSRISDLVNIIHTFLPFTSRAKNSVTFYSIFKESNVDKYLNKSLPKKQALQLGFENLFRHHKKLPYIIIRKIVPNAINYRRYKRNPIKKDEIIKLNECLLSLNINMQKELLSIEIDETIPEIKVPPEKLVKRLEDHPLVKEIASEPLELFKNGHFNESVRKSAERFEKRVQQISHINDIGKNLMARVFKLESPIIKLNSLSTENEKGIQEGFQLMAMGMMRAIRNVFSHGDENQRSPEECYEMLLFINWLFKKLPK